MLRRRQWYLTPVLLPRKSHGQRSLVGCSPWGLLLVGNDWATSLSLFTFIHWRRKWQPTPVFLPGESQGQGSLAGCRLLGSHRVGHDWSDLAASAGVQAWKTKLNDHRCQRSPCASKGLSWGLLEFSWHEGMWDFLWSRGGKIPTLNKELWTWGWCGWENYVCCSKFLLVSSSRYIPEG